MFLLVTWTHLVAAMVWVGGMLFLTLVLVPVMRAGSVGGQARELFRSVALRFRGAVWVAIAVLMSTGFLLMSRRVASLGDPSVWPWVLKVKLGLVAAMIGVTLAHDFWLGPLARRAMPAGSDDPRPGAGLLIKASPWLARLGLFLGLGVLLTAVALVRT